MINYGSLINIDQTLT